MLGSRQSPRRGLSELLQTVLVCAPDPARGRVGRSTAVGLWGGAPGLEMRAFRLEMGPRLGGARPGDEGLQIGDGTPAWGGPGLEMRPPRMEMGPRLGGGPAWR